MAQSSGIELIQQEIANNINHNADPADSPDTAWSDVSKTMYHQMKDITWLQIIGGSVGNILEWYDFATFGLLASEIGSNFFATDSNGKSNHAIELLKAYGVFGGAFIMRPVGGVIFGAIGDKMGRKRALQISMILMFIATFTMGCLPGVATIGVWAPILLTILRLFQGISVGGQLVGSILFIVESARADRRGFWGSVAMMTAVVGSVVASWIIAFLNTILSAQQMRDWGWRLPFLSSFIVAILGLLSQTHMEQSTEFLTASKLGKIAKNPVKNALKNHWRVILLIVMIVIPWCAAGYLTFTWLPIYVQKQLKIDHALLMSSFLMIVLMGCLVLGGYLADKYNYYVVMKVGAVIVCVWGVPAYYLMNSVYVVHQENVLWPLVIADMGFALGLGLFGGPMQIFMVHSIDDVAVRYSAIGVAYNACHALFGGTAPLVGSALSLVNFIYVGVYISVFAAVSAVLVHWMGRNISTRINDLSFQSSK
eukprot:4662_1